MSCERGITGVSRFRNRRLGACERDFTCFNRFRNRTLCVWTSLKMLNAVRIYPNIVALMADSKRLQLRDIKKNKQRKSCDDWIGKCIHKRTASSCLQWVSKPWQKHWFDCGWYQDIDDRMLSYRWIQLRTQLQDVHSVHCPSLFGGLIGGGQ